MCTLAFSHLRRTALDDCPASWGIQRVESVGPLSVRHPLGIYATTVDDATTISFVHDPAQLDDASVASLANSFEEILRRGVEELAA
jgi:hypothetical protein